MAHASKLHCPNCDSTNVARVLYGMPDLTDWLEKRLESGSIVLGGCSVTGDDADRFCNDCETYFFSEYAKHQVKGVLKVDIEVTDTNMQVPVEQIVTIDV